MPVITLVSPKGGAGKSTVALVLALEFAADYPTTLIDADPNGPLQSWAEGGNVPPNLTIVSHVDEDNILKTIKRAAESTPIVLVDLEGTAAKIVVLALTQADFAIIPLQPSQLDAAQANRAIKVIEECEVMTRRKLPYSVLLTRTSQTIRTRTLTHIQRTLEGSQIPVLHTELHEREAYRAIFSFQQTLAGLNPAEVSNLDKAQANARQLTDEILTLLTPQTAEETASQNTEQVA